MMMTDMIWYGVQMTLWRSNGSDEQELLDGASIVSIISWWGFQNSLWKVGLDYWLTKWFLELLSQLQLEDVFTVTLKLQQILVFTSIASFMFYQIEQNEKK